VNSGHLPVEAPPFPATLIPFVIQVHRFAQPLSARAGRVCVHMRITTCAFFTTCTWHCMLCVSECVVVCRCFDMQSKSPAPECNISLLGSHQARVTVNSGSMVTQPTLSSGLGRGVVITPLSAGHTVQSQDQHQIFVNPARQANTIVPKLLHKITQTYFNSTKSSHQFVLLLFFL